MKSVKQMMAELFRSAGDGSVSLSKTMKAVAFITCTYVVLLQAHRGELNMDFFLIYFGLAVGNDQLGKWQSIRREVKQSANSGDWPANQTSQTNKVE